MPDRPRIEVPLGPVGLVGEVVAGVAIVAVLAVTAVGLASVGPQMPTNFDAHGQPTAWGSRASFAGVSVCVVVLYLLFTVASRHPHGFSYAVDINPDNAERQYRLMRSGLPWVKAAMTWTFAAIQWGTLQTARGASEGLGGAFFPVALVLNVLPLAAIAWASWRAR